MAVFKNLEERFLQTMDTLYSLKTHPYKESADLNPIIVYAPNDPNRPQGIGNTDRTVPIGAVLLDEKRMTKWLTSPRGIKFFLKQELLQTGNAISETRIIDPLFINKNLSPYAHSKRQLLDQTDIIVNDPNRSPATTPEVGLAGRLQRQTGANAMSHIMGRKNARQSILDVLSSSQIGQTVSGILGITNGTYGINQRPEFDVSGRWYSAILYTGRKPLLNRELDVAIDALGTAGVIAGMVGLPNIFGGLRGVPPLPATSNFSTGGSDPLGTMPYFNPEIPGVNPNEAGRYVEIRSIREPGTLLPTLIPTDIRKIVQLGLTTAIKNLLGLQFGSATKLASALSFNPNIAIGPEVALATNDDELGRLRKPERSLRTRYEKPTDPTTVLSPDSRERIQTIKARLDQQAKDLKTLHPDYAQSFSKLGFGGGITLNNIAQFTSAKTFAESQEIRSKMAGTKVKKGYMTDLLNMVPEVKDATKMPKEIDGVPVPTDLIKVHFVDVVNSRVIPFRALLGGLSEAVAAEYSPTRYIGRMERNIIYLGATRQLRFSLYVHAWSSEEMQPIWQRINSLTGLLFPSKYSDDGFMIPPIVKLTLGDFYTDQPGYIASLEHTVEDDVSWEIDEGSQVPMTVKISITFDVIEKFAMHAQAGFYGFPNTQRAPLAGVASAGPITSAIPLTPAAALSLPSRPPLSLR